jgi:hypothetical protein
MYKSILFLIVLAVSSAFVSGGCGSSDAPPLATLPVAGKISYKGKPLTQGTVTFAPEDGFGREASGPIQSDGSFTLSTFKTGDGAVPGVHRVAVTGTGKNGKELIPPKFRNTSSSRVEVEVKPGQSEYVVDLK